jgi:hypothetical protein
MRRYVWAVIGIKASLTAAGALVKSIAALASAREADRAWSLLPPAYSAKVPS